MALTKMINKTKVIQIAIQASILAASAISLSGCDQLRSKVADLIAPESPQDELKMVNGLVDSGKYKEARDKAVARADKQDVPLRGEFALAAARSYGYLGDVDGAIRYLVIAFNALDLNPDEPLSDIAFGKMRTNVRFLQAIAELKPDRSVESKPQRVDKSQEIEVSAGGNTQIKMGGNGTEVRAGDVVIKMPN
jgi:hypothetical protein